MRTCAGFWNECGALTLGRVIWPESTPTIGVRDAFDVAHLHGALGVDTFGVAADAASIGLPIEDRDAATSYIAAIVARDPRAREDTAFAAWRARDLWERFDTEYVAVASGAYARHGRAAVRIALGRL